MSGKKVFVGGLAWATDDDSLYNFFTEAGDVAEAKVITDRDTGRSRGFGFVTFADDDGAANAVEMSDRELDGRAIRVDFAQDKRR